MAINASLPRAEIACHSKESLLCESGRTTSTCHVERSVWLIEDGLLRINQTFVNQSVSKGQDVTGPYWILGLITIHSGQMSFLHGNQSIHVPWQTVGMFIPSYSITQVAFKEASLSTIGFSSKRSFSRFNVTSPIIFPLETDFKVPKSHDEIEDLLSSSARNSILVSRESNPTALARKVKEVIDREYKTSLNLAQIGQEIGVSSQALSRAFKRSYGFTAVEYRTWLRVMEATSELAAGKAVLDTSFEVGFEDVSRFYKQFRKVTFSPPGSYRPRKNSKPVKKRQDSAR